MVKSRKVYKHKRVSRRHKLKNKYKRTLRRTYKGGLGNKSVEEEKFEVEIKEHEDNIKGCENKQEQIREKILEKYSKKKLLDKEDTSKIRNLVDMWLVLENIKINQLKKLEILIRKYIYYRSIANPAAIAIR